MPDTVPPWLQSMQNDLGVEEIPGAAVNPRIIAKARLPGVKFPNVPGLVAYGLEYNSDDTQAWCGAEAGGCLAEVGIMPPFGPGGYDRYFWAASFRTWGVACDLRVGAIACYDGHVNFVDEIIDADTFWGIGGNQSSPKGGAVTRSKRNRSSVLALRWPDNAALAAAGLSQFSLSAKPGDAATTTIRPLILVGSSGGFVTELQKILAIPTTGIFDTATDAAVRAFQRQHGLDIDGEVGPNTWAALLGTSITIAGDVPHAAEYADYWRRMTILPEHANELDTIARKLIGNKTRYQAAVAGTKVPWFFVAVIHQRESSTNFSKNIHNGQALGQVTTIEPLGRGPFNSFEDSVNDWIALKGLNKIATWPIERFAYQCELNNGMGYRNRGVPSAYLWSFSNIYCGGKYIADHVWSATAMDAQCGTMPMLKQMMALDASIVFAVPIVEEPIDGEVLDPLKTGDTPAESGIGGLVAIGAGLFLLMKFLEKSPMTDKPTGQGLDLSKLLADLPKLISILHDPVLQKVLSNKPVTLQEILSLLPVLLQLLPSHIAALSPPATTTEPEPVKQPDPVKVNPSTTGAGATTAGAPAATSSTLQKITTNAAAALVSIVTGLGLGSAGVISTPMGESSGLVGQLWPLISIGAAALNIPAPLVGMAQTLFSRLRTPVAPKTT